MHGIYPYWYRVPGTVTGTWYPGTHVHTNQFLCQINYLLRVPVPVHLDSPTAAAPKNSETDRRPPTGDNRGRRCALQPPRLLLPATRTVLQGSASGLPASLISRPVVVVAAVSFIAGDPIRLRFPSAAPLFPFPSLPSRPRCQLAIARPCISRPAYRKEQPPACTLGYSSRLAVPRADPPACRSQPQAQAPKR